MTQLTEQKKLQAKGYDMPSLIVSTQKIYRDDAAKYTCTAIKSGHRHIDTAWINGNEVEVGQGIKQSGVPREELFITTRIWTMPARPESVASGLERTLDNLKLDYVDLCLMHWPLPGGSSRDPRAASLLLTWKVMERLFKSGKAKAIGVSNITAEQLGAILTTASIFPSVCQADVSPTQTQALLRDLCDSRGICFWAAPPKEKLETAENGTCITLTTYDVGGLGGLVPIHVTQVVQEAC